MNVPQTAEVIEAGVYDTSRGASRSNWQWGTVCFDNAWEEVAALIHQGWPVEQREFSDQHVVLLGVIRRSEFVWLYRVYPAGRDEHGRPGRYFFVVIRLPSLEWITHPQVDGLLAYFEKERGLPLNIRPLESGWPDVEPDSVLVQLRKVLEETSRFGHWGVDGTERMVRLLDREPAKMESNENRPSAGRRRLILGALLILAGVIVFSILHRSDSDVIPKENEGKTTSSSSPSTADARTKTPETNPASESSKPQSDEQMPLVDPPAPPKPIRQLTDPIRTNSNDDSPPSDPTPDHSPQSPTRSPESETEP